MKRQTREEWLHKAIAILKSGVFKRNGFKIPKIKVSVGFPGGGSARKRIGEHWSPEASTDKVGSIFISPTLGKVDVVLATLVHELVHASVGNKVGHGVQFKRCATAVGLVGKMRSTEAGPELKKELKKLAKKIGKYPHAELKLGKGPTKKQTTRMVKMSCSDCGYIVRASMSAILNFGPVLCPCNHEPMKLGAK